MDHNAVKRLLKAGANVRYRDRKHRLTPLERIWNGDLLFMFNRGYRDNNSIWEMIGIFREHDLQLMGWSSIPGFFSGTMEEFLEAEEDDY